MDNKISPERSSPSSKQEQIRQNCVEHFTFRGYIRRQSLFPTWKPVTLTLVQSPHQHLLLTLRNPNPNPSIQQVINITYSRLGKKILDVDHRSCFGVILPSKKKYLFAGEAQRETCKIYAKLSSLKHVIKEKYQSENSAEKGEGQGRLEYEPCLSNKDMQKCSTSAFTPKRSLFRDRREQQQREMDIDESFCTAQKFQSEMSYPQGDHRNHSLHLQTPISQLQTQYLCSDQNFKLRQNFPQGRLLTNSPHLIKANLLLTTSLSSSQLLQSLFHLQLWNGRVKTFTLINRIDKGIYLCKLELHKHGLLSLPRYCYIMVNTCRIQGDLGVVFRSLPKEQFEEQVGWRWIGMSLWARVREGDGEEEGEGGRGEKLMNVCGEFEEDDFEAGVRIVEEVKVYQTFLKTTGHLPQPTLQWHDSL